MLAGKDPGVRSSFASRPTVILKYFKADSCSRDNSQMLIIILNLIFSLRIQMFMLYFYAMRPYIKIHTQSAGV